MRTEQISGTTTVVTHPLLYPIGGERDPFAAALKRVDGLLEYAIEHGDEAEAERFREELTLLVNSLT